LHIPAKTDDYPVLSSMIGDTLNQAHLLNHWEEVLRLGTSIRQGTVTASLMLKKLGSYPRQNGLALALRKWEESSGRSSCWNGCKTRSCGAAFRSD